MAVKTPCEDIGLKRSEHLQPCPAKHKAQGRDTAVEEQL
jgi:hypothetical protein